MRATSKSAWKSKLNGIGAVMTLLGLLADPTFQGYLAGVLPADVLAKVLSIGGILVMVLRTCCTDQAVTVRRQ